MLRADFKLNALRGLFLILLLATLAACSSKPKPLPQGLTNEIAVTEVQSALLAAGYPPGPVDGVMGPKTQTAIRDYQKAHGLPVNGIIDSTLQQALLSEAGPGTFSAGNGFDRITWLYPPYPRPIRNLIAQRYEAAERAAAQEGKPTALDVATVDLSERSGGERAVLIAFWGPYGLQDSELSVYVEERGGFRPVLDRVVNQGYELADSFSDGMRDILVRQSGTNVYRRYRFDGSIYR